jgi:hypothetical protein
MLPILLFSQTEPAITNKFRFVITDFLLAFTIYFHYLLSLFNAIFLDTHNRTGGATLPTLSKTLIIEQSF